MATHKNGKLWIGIGAAAFIGGGGIIARTEAADPQSPTSPGATAVPGSHAGHASPKIEKVQQGGEGEGVSDGLDPRVKFFRDMGLIRGHLLVGDELVKAGLWEDGLPHFHHPAEELYSQIAPKLKLQGLRQFDTALKALAQAVQAKNATAYGTALKAVTQRMDETDKAMRNFATPYLVSRMKTITAILRTAAGEYAEAIEANRIAKPVEYQDSRGFVLFAEKLLNDVEPDLEKKDKDALAAIRVALTTLKTAWPKPLPPASPVMDHGAVVAAVDRVEMAASPFLK